MLLSSALLLLASLIAPAVAQPVAGPAAEPVAEPIAEPIAEPAHSLEARAPGEIMKFSLAFQGEYCLGPEGNWNGAKLVLLKCSDPRTHHRREGWLIRFVNAGNKCLDVPDGTAVNGGRPQIWDCNPNNMNQQWTHIGSGSYTWINMPRIAPTKCLDLKDGRRAVGNPIQFWDCYADNINQRLGFLGP